MYGKLLEHHLLNLTTSKRPVVGNDPTVFSQLYASIGVNAPLPQAVKRSIDSYIVVHLFYYNTIISACTREAVRTLCKLLIVSENPIILSRPVCIVFDLSRYKNTLFYKFWRKSHENMNLYEDR